MNNKSIGIFDSGLGGLTVVKQLTKILPNEHIVYFGDTGRVPYGNKSFKTIIRYALQDATFLKKCNVKYIVAACGTVSSMISQINKEFDMPINGVLNPACIKAAEQTKNGKIGVIGTSTTIRSGSYSNQLNSINPDIEVFLQECPLFVPLVENGFINNDNNITKLVCEHYLNNLKKLNIDTLIMGCTHYPIIKSIIGDIMGDSVTLIDSGKETAIHTAEALKENDKLSDYVNSPIHSFYVSDSIEGFSNIANIFLSDNINYDVKQINIEDY